MISNKANGMDFSRRKTKQRGMVLEAVGELDHPTAKETYEHITNAASRFLKENISLGTIYRNLQVLEDEGKIIAVSCQDAVRYDVRVEDHYHILCVKCGRVMDMPVAYKHDLDLEAEERGGGMIESHSILFRGVCAECSARPNPAVSRE
ncbi:MAG: transcriptional repressor [Spirochaetaceae bacterium]|jgi:Fe2+ or Zn2+ uptake regulation protein|nr:transcriptional repressor [Spirochaetaceae bacterium]